MILARNIIKRRFSSVNPLILGIETSCDDTGAAILRGNEILAECLSSQLKQHMRFGGIIPPVAQDFHRQNIDGVVKACFERARVEPEQLDAIAFTNRPGLPLSLLIGLRYARHLSKLYQKPLIPIHHMWSHALTPRLEQNVQFPFLCLLISGGHCLLSFVRDIDQFTLLGESIDDSPGELLDKVARMMKLFNLKQFRNKSGGQAIEEAARMCKEPTNKYYFPLLLKYYRDCNFSFAGLKNTTNRHLLNEKKRLNLDVDEVLPDYPDFCANIQGAIARHLAHRVQRGMEFCQEMKWFDDVREKTLVVSGGVACNDFIFESLSQLCDIMNFKAIRPSRKLCTDNGLMIAWCGVEHFRREKSICPTDKIYELDFYAKSPLGDSVIEKVKEKNIACKWAKIPILKPFARP